MDAASRVVTMGVAGEAEEEADIRAITHTIGAMIDVMEIDMSIKTDGMISAEMIGIDVTIMIDQLMEVVVEGSHEMGRP